ncbi:MAG TPA: hypothetical protein VGD17_00705 [Chitinophagaceae bacterium]
MKILSVTFLAITIITTAYGQTKPANYEADWRRVDSLFQQRGLTRSALDGVQRIYAKAKKENNQPQLIKALIYRINLQQNIQEKGIIEGIYDLEKETAASEEPVRSILRSILAQNYWMYFQQHRWQLYDRTTTRNFNKSDLETWSAEDFHRRISELYLQSVRSETLLQQTKLEPFDALIIKGNVRYLRPTLFDLVAHRALEYFTSNERDVNKPAYAFEISDPKAFADAASFTAHRFVTMDSLSFLHKAIELYQHIIAFHLKDQKPAAFIDADINRLQFVNQYGVA